MSREEARFLRGEVGVDGQAIDEEPEIEALERGKAVDDLGRNRSYLGREFLTWLLYQTNSGDALASVDDEDVIVLIVGKVVLRGLAGEATELAVKGHLSAYSNVVRHAIGRGLLVHTARLRITHGERAFEVTLDAEHLDFKGAEIPALLSEEEDDKITERLWLVERLGEIVDALWNAFLTVRTAKVWESREVPAIQAWLAEPGE